MRVAVVVTIVLVMAMLASLWQHWAKVREPTTAIAVYGDESLDGARIVVEGADEETQRERPVQVVLSADHKYQQAIYRYPGRYRVSVTLPGRKEPIAEGTPLAIDRVHGVVLDLPTTLTIDGGPGDKVTIANGTTSQTVEFNQGNHYRVPVLLSAGKYTMTRTHGAEVVQPEEEVVILPHTPKTIKLREIP